MSLSFERKITAASDEELMRGVQADDVRAFEALYDRNVARAWRLARSVCRDPGRAEDAVQDACVSAWQSRRSYRHDTGSVRSWLMTIVRNRASTPSAARPPRAVPDSPTATTPAQTRPMARHKTK